MFIISINIKFLSEIHDRIHELPPVEVKANLGRSQRGHGF